MPNTLNRKDSLAIGVMLFGLLFGAGNLIFPIFLGKSAGSSMPEASLGLLVTAVGLPLLGVAAMGMTQSKSVFDLTASVHSSFSYFYTFLLYLTIGPLFAIPRLSTVAFEVGTSHFLPKDHSAPWLLAFSFLFYALALYFALRPAKILTVVGTILTPAFLLFLGVLIFVSIINPVGNIQLSHPSAGYEEHAFFLGLLSGYNTMDALASLAFGIIIINSVKSKGVTEPKLIAKEVIKSGVICTIFMSLIYIALAYLGATTTNIFPETSNGGQIFNALASHYFGVIGSIFLFTMVSLACLKTGIGLITAISETFVEMFPNTMSYKQYASLVTISSFALANAGLDRIIKFSIPVLMFLYPLTIVLILLAIASPLFNNSARVYQITLMFTLLASIGDFLRATPTYIKTTVPVQAFLSIYERYLPFSESGMGWILPSLLGAVLASAYYIGTKQRISRY
ncbi:branched-chain amino acid transport system II carrier protein [Atopobacter sp. AH10]|uniref:branched-chain amino acid transport system II carrier protein n=1 Tax=Atopobacter sp. AH10 TaxID=2315861 RepID=UPI000EF22DD8|nr:branched-chain amino acid transport system II carrier protein [Atopobacter sp. AH10]RLK62629.1 branched-chain amino acid transport system II carrier protein [Atopobacter sp. AH10]